MGDHINRDAIFYFVFFSSKSRKMYKEDTSSPLKPVVQLLRATSEWLVPCSPAVVLLTLRICYTVLASQHKIQGLQQQIDKCGALKKISHKLMTNIITRLGDINTVKGLGRDAPIRVEGDGQYNNCLGSDDG